MDREGECTSGVLARRTRCGWGTLCRCHGTRSVSAARGQGRGMAVSSTTSGILDQSAVDLAMQHDPRLYNKDLAPTTVAQRTWGTYNYIALWFSMSMEVTTYMLASSLIAGGMNWKQAVGTG